MKFTTEEISFYSGQEKIYGTLYSPVSKEPLAAVAFGHGWGMVAGGDLEDYAQATASKGIAALTFDYRRLGRSEGLPRQEIDPSWQHEDYRSAITFLASHPAVDDQRLGIWGTSYSGGHVLFLGATDPRVKCVVSQVPTISGYYAGLKKTRISDLDALHERFSKDRVARLNGQPEMRLREVGEDGALDVAYPGAESRDYMLGQGERCPNWRNEITLRSLELARCYEPGTWISRIGPKPLLMIVADNDLQTPTDLQLDAYQAAREPKQLLLLKGGHYSAYQEHFSQTSSAAAEWFYKHLNRSICNGGRP